MRSVIVTLTFFISVGANASSVVIDFEGVSCTDPICTAGAVSSKGYLFQTFGSNVRNPEVWVSSDGFAFQSDEGLFGPDPEVSIAMTSTGNSVFAIHSANLLGQTAGLTSSGAIADLTAPIGTGDWLDLRSFSVTSTGGPLGSGNGVYVTASVDDIVVSAVPVPAALWLFGSALAGLGWLRRKAA